jgi:GMP synthase (glutamine-hydrolysing)
MEPGTDIENIASADHARVFRTHHRSAPLWAVQFHPEITAAHRDNLITDFGWESEQFSFEDVTAGQVFENFVKLAAEATT